MCRSEPVSPPPHNEGGQSLQQTGYLLLSFRFETAAYCFCVPLLLPPTGANLFRLNRPGVYCMLFPKNINKNKMCEEERLGIEHISNILFPPKISRRLPKLILFDSELAIHQ